MAVATVTATAEVGFMVECKTCRDDFDEKDIDGNGNCANCDMERRFATFATECGLTRFVHPRGERYVYNTNLHLAGKKVDETDFMDELWNALARAKGRLDLIVEQ